MMSITVAICTYDNPDALRHALAALQDQRVPRPCEWSVLVVDNNSDRITRPVVEEFRARAALPALRLVCEPRQGLSFARRRAVLESDTDLLAFVDDDCVLDCDWVASAAAFFARHPRAGAVGGRVRLRWEKEPEPVVALYARAFASQDYGDQAQQAPPDAVSFLAGAGLVVRRKAILESGWLDEFLLLDRTAERLSAGGDSELVLRIRLAGYEIWYTPDLRLDHVIAAERATLPHLCRLSRGFGASEPAIFVTRRRSVAARVAAPLLFLGSGAWHILRQSGRYTAATLRQRSDERTFARVALHRHIGRVGAACRLLGQNPFRPWRPW